MDSCGRGMSETGKAMHGHQLSDPLQWGSLSDPSASCLASPRCWSGLAGIEAGLLLHRFDLPTADTDSKRAKRDDNETSDSPSGPGRELDSLRRREPAVASLGGLAQSSHHDH